MKRLIDDNEAHRIAWNTHEGLEIHYVLRGRFTWEIRNSRKQLSGQTPTAFRAGLSAKPPPARTRTVGF